MRILRLLAALALATAAGCADTATAVRPAELAATWHASASDPAPLTTHQWLELRPDGTFAWTTEVYGPGGRVEDGLLETLSQGGDWETRGERLALRTLWGVGWAVEDGASRADYAAAWDDRHRVRIEGGRLHLTFEPRPEDSSVRRTTVFERVGA